MNAADRGRARVPGTGKRRYFGLRPPDFLAARKEIPARMAFCWTAAAVRPSWRATSLVGVPALASCFRLRNSPALHEEPSFEGRFAISLFSNHPMRVCWNDSRRFWPPRAQHGVLTCCKSLCFWVGNSSLHGPPDGGLTAPSVPQRPCATAASRADRRRKRPRTAARADSNLPRYSQRGAMPRARLRGYRRATQTR